MFLHYASMISNLEERNFFQLHSLFSCPFLSNGQISLREMGRREHPCKPAFHPSLWSFWFVQDFCECVNPLPAWKNMVINRSVLSSVSHGKPFLQLKSLPMKKVLFSGSAGKFQAKSSLWHNTGENCEVSCEGGC